MIKKSLFALLVLTQLWLLFFVFGDSIIYAKSGIYRWLPYLIIMGGIPFSIYFLLQQFRGKKEVKQVVSGASILLVGPIFGVWAYFTSEADLEKNGVQTKGLIIESGRNVKCVFLVEGKSYSSFAKRNVGHKVKSGDFVTVIYSTRNPENNKVPILE